MRRGETTGGGIFELTVDGTLGPVLRSAVRPGRSVDEPHTYTTLCAAAATDLVGLIQLLDSYGLSIESVSRLPLGRDVPDDGTTG